MFTYQKDYFRKLKKRSVCLCQNDGKLIVFKLKSLINSVFLTVFTYKASQLLLRRMIIIVWKVGFTLTCSFNKIFTECFQTMQLTFPITSFIIYIINFAAVFKTYYDIYLLTPFPPQQITMNLQQYSCPLHPNQTLNTICIYGLCENRGLVCPCCVDYSHQNHPTRPLLAFLEQSLQLYKRSSKQMGFSLTKMNEIQDLMIAPLEEDEVVSRYEREVDYVQHRLEQLTLEEDTDRRRKLALVAGIRQMMRICRDYIGDQTYKLQKWNIEYTADREKIVNRIRSQVDHYLRNRKMNVAIREKTAYFMSKFYQQLFPPIFKYGRLHNLNKVKNFSEKVCSKKFCMDSDDEKELKWSKNLSHGAIHIKDWVVTRDNIHPGIPAGAYSVSKVSKSYQGCFEVILRIRRLVSNIWIGFGICQNLKSPNTLLSLPLNPPLGHHMLLSCTNTQNNTNSPSSSQLQPFQSGDKIKLAYVLTKGQQMDQNSQRLSNRIFVKFQNDKNWRSCGSITGENVRFCVFLLGCGDSVEILRAGPKRNVIQSRIFGDGTQDTYKNWCSDREHRSGSQEEEEEEKQRMEMEEQKQYADWGFPTLHF